MEMAGHAWAYTWEDKGHKVIITFEIPITVQKKKVVVNVRDDGGIFIGFDRPPMQIVVDGTLSGLVKGKKTDWKVKSSKVSVKIEKKNPEPWPRLLQEVCAL